MKTYVMSDIHGAYAEFQEMLEKINFKDEDKLIINGDVCDRGKDSLALIEFIISSKNIVWLRGNHEDIMIKALTYNDSFNMRMWLSNGGIKLHKALMEKGETYINNLLSKLRLLPFYHIHNNFIITHANITHNDYLNTDSFDNISDFMEAQENTVLLWDRSDVANKLEIPNYTAIFGHTPVQSITNNKTNRILHMKEKIYIDCGVSTCDSGQLACLRLDDMQEFYVERIKDAK